MDILQVNQKHKKYPIYMNTEYRGFIECIDDIPENNRLIVITDENVDKWQADYFIKRLEDEGYKVIKFVIGAGEEFKVLEVVKEIYSFLFANKVDRSSILISLGGGVVGDIVGFVAATYLRGVKLIQVPTTLLAQIDSSVGGKVGVNFNGIKNAIGSFYNPEFVYTNVNALKTLESRQLRAGIAECICHALIKDEKLFDFIDKNIESILALEEDTLLYLVNENCKIKASFVEKDEFDQGIRAVLNFGHTFGHAIESVYEFQLLHGECVSLGMICAFKLSQKLGKVTKEDTEKVIKLLLKVGLPTHIKDIKVDEIIKQMSYDKKIRKNKIKFILPERIGQVSIYTIEDIPRGMELVKESISSIGEA